MSKPSTTREAQALWQRVAAGERTPELDRWIADVARQVLDVFAFDGPANRRADAALKAVGFRGRFNTHEELLEFVDQCDAADDRSGSERYKASAFFDAVDLAIEVGPSRRAVEMAIKRHREQRDSGNA